MIRIDWDDQLDAVRRRLATGGGGVIRVRSSPGAAASSFAKVLRKELLDSNPGRWSIVTIGPRDGSTHYVADIVAQISVVIARSPEEPGTAERGSVIVGQDIKTVTGDITIQDVSIRQEVDPQESLIQEYRAANSLLEAVETFLATGDKLCIIFTDSQDHDQRELERFRNVVWDDRLETLCSRGVLLVSMAEDRSGGPEDWPPHPDTIVDLPARLSGSAREQAERDLAEIARAWFPDWDAGQFAESALMGTSSTAELYAYVANVVADGGGT